jgi:hypothetical protein
VTICPTWPLNRLSLKPIHNRTHSKKLGDYILDLVYLTCDCAPVKRLKLVRRFERRVTESGAKYPLQFTLKGSGEYIE